MNFTFSCIACRMHDFAFDSESLLLGGLPSVVFVCPKCNEPNCVKSGPAGSIVVSAGMPERAKPERS